MANRLLKYNSQSDYDAAKGSLLIPYVAIYPSTTDGKTVVVYANADGTNTSEVIATAQLTTKLTELESKCEILDTIDDEPTSGSNNLVKSGGVYEMAQYAGIYDLLTFTVINDNSSGTSERLVGPIDYTVSISKGSIVKFSIQNLQKTGSGYIQVFAYKGSKQLEFISLTDDMLQNGDYYIILSDDCDKLRLIYYCNKNSSISCILSTSIGKLSNIGKELQDIDKELRDIDNKTVKFYPELIQTNFVDTRLPDANEALPNTMYQFASSNIPANMPSSITLLGSNEILLTTSTKYVYGNTNWKHQYLFDSKFNLLYSRMYSGSWSEWEKANTSMHKYPNIVVAENINSVLPDVNNALSNTIYRLQSSVNPANFPSYFLAGEFVYLETRDSYYIQGSQNQKQQTIYDHQMRPLWTRSCQGTTWTDWVSIWHHIKVGQGSAYGYHKGWSFSKLYDALVFAANNPNTEIEVFNGTYDLISEMGDDWATNYYGIPLGANMKIKFHENAYVTCNYTGDDQRKLTEFSVFAVIGGDFEIDGLKLSCSRVRYPIHDDNANNQLTHIHIYKNCEIIFDNSQNEIWDSKQCIGGGFGNSTKVIIENCYFESVGADETHPEVSYHNSGYGTSAKSGVIINNCYFKNSSCWFGYYGLTQLMSLVRVSNCSMKWLPKVINETGDAPNVNIELKQWNNEIRL